MNFKSGSKGFLRIGKYDVQSKYVTQENSQKYRDSGFTFKLYSLITFLFLGTVGCINWLVDPLWYSHGNIVTGKNFAFNERISKTNLFLKTKDKENYDCVILGSSRAIALRPSNFQENSCFNYALKGGTIEDFVNYAQFLQEAGLNPQKVYIGIDGSNFVAEKRTERQPFDIEKVATRSLLHAYLSADVLLFSVMTLLGISPDPGNYYDRDFELVDFNNPPVYKAQFYKPLEPQQCDLSLVQPFANLRKIFPDAEFIGYVPPRSAWSMVNDTYGRDLMDCYLAAFYQIGQKYDAMYDFSVPSEVTKNPDNTFDGSHYSVTVNNEIAAILQGKSNNFGIKVDELSYEDYHHLYMKEIKQFLTENDQLERWRE